MAKYSIIFYNNSTNPWDFCCFQQDQDLKVNGVMSLAWFAKKCYPSTTCTFSWDINYSFVWGETGELKPGVTFDAAQVVNADLANSNIISLDYSDAFYFTGKGSATPPGSIYIDQTANVPGSKASVGIGMSGTGTFVVQAEPNINLTFTPHPTYYVAFGEFITGQVLDIQEMTLGAEVLFPPAVYVMYAILNADNTWTISQNPPALKVNKLAGAQRALVA